MSGLLGSASSSSIEELAALLLANGHKHYKPRSEWLRMFEGWAGPASNTEDERVQRTEEKVSESITSGLNGEYKIKVFAQGSSVNNTNVKTVSDVDLIALVKEPMWIESTPDHLFSLGLGSAPQHMDIYYSYFCARVFHALNASFPQSRIRYGKKCIKLDATNSTRVNCDIVPAFRLGKYKTNYQWPFSSNQYDECIVFYDMDGNQVVSYPEQHLINGKARNTQTNHRYKQVVRVLKMFAKRYKGSAVQTLFSPTKLPSSFMIECLVYNVKPELLTSNGDDLYQCVSTTVNHLSYALTRPDITNTFDQVSEKKKLFPHWGIPTMLTPHPRPREVEICADFINRVKSNIRT